MRLGARSNPRFRTSKLVLPQRRIRRWEAWLGILYQILYRECLKHTDREGSNIMSNTPAWHLVHISNPPSADVVLADGSTIGHLVQTFEGNGWAAVSSTGRRLGRSDNITRAAVLVVDAHRAGGRA